MTMEPTGVDLNDNAQAALTGSDFSGLMVACCEVGLISPRLGNRTYSSTKDIAFAG